MKQIFIKNILFGRFNANINFNSVDIANSGTNLQIYKKGDFFF